MMEIKKVAKEQKIWNKEKEVANSEKETKKLVSLRSYEQIYIFEKKVSERMIMRKVWNHVIELKEGFVPKNRKVYSLSRKERRDI